MPLVSGADVKAMIGFLHDSPGGTRADPVPRATLRALARVIPADSIEYFELRRSDRALLAASSSHDRESLAAVDRAVLAYGHQNPLNWRRWHPMHGAIRLARVMPRRDLERLEFYEHVIRPLRIRDELKVWIWSTSESAACIDLVRCDADFSSRDERVLTILQQHLIEMRRSALAHGSTRVSYPALTPREAEVLTWVARGWANDEIAVRMGISPSTVRKHLQHVFEKLDVRTRGEAIWLITALGDAEA